MKWLNIFSQSEKMFCIILYFAELNFALSLDFAQVNLGDSIFLKPALGYGIDVNLREGLSGWNKSFTTSNLQKCPNQCHLNAECKSAVYDADAGVCNLKDVNRLSPNAEITLKDNNFVFYGKRTVPFERVYRTLVRNAFDCKDVYDKGYKKSGVYVVGSSTVNQYHSLLCEMELAGGGWTVLQQRVDGSVSFDREWVAYKHGFGTFNGNFWLGNDRIHNLTTSTIQNELLFDLTTLDDSKFYPAYDNFKVDGENERYKLTVGGYVNKEMTGDSFTSSMADSLDYHNGMEFSTKDRDHDTKADQNCAATRKSGWWFIGCWRVSLNGVYGESDTKAIGWDFLTNPTSSVHTQRFKYTRMLVRKK